MLRTLSIYVCVFVMIYYIYICNNNNDNNNNNNELYVQSSGYRSKLEINMACCDFGTPREKIMTRSEIEQTAPQQQTSITIYF